MIFIERKQAAVLTFTSNITANSTLLIRLAQKETMYNWFYFVCYLFQLPEWLEKLSPFSLVSKLPIEGMNWLNADGLIAVTVILIIIGINRYSNRDVEG